MSYMLPMSGYRHSHCSLTQSVKQNPLKYIDAPSVTELSYDWHLILKDMTVLCISCALYKPVYEMYRTLLFMIAYD